MILQNDTDNAAIRTSLPDFLIWGLHPYQKVVTTRLCFEVRCRGTALRYHCHEQTNCEK